MAAGIRFRVSIDNLNAGEYDSSVFIERVQQQVAEYLSCGLSGRAQQFTQSLLAFYQPHQTYANFCVAMGLAIPASMSQQLPEMSAQQTAC